MKFWNFETTDDALLTLSGLSTLGYGAQMLAAPGLQQRLYFEDSVPQSTQWTQWFGNALVMSAGHQINMNNMGLSKSQKKTALKSCAVAHTLASGLMIKQMSDNDFKKPIGIASAVMQASLAIACAVRSVAEDDNDNEE